MGYTVHMILQYLGITFTRPGSLPHFGDSLHLGPAYVGHITKTKLQSI